MVADRTDFDAIRLVFDGQNAVIEGYKANNAPGIHSLDLEFEIDPTVVPRLLNFYVVSRSFIE